MIMPYWIKNLSRIKNPGKTEACPENPAEPERIVVIKWR